VLQDKVFGDVLKDYGGHQTSSPKRGLRRRKKR
jgi:hypothetical protein